MTGHPTMQCPADDYGLVAAELWLALSNKSFRQCFTRSQRQRMLKLRAHFMQLASNAMGEEEAPAANNAKRSLSAERHAACHRSAGWKPTNGTHA
jgi:hypothetical protein